VIKATSIRYSPYGEKDFPPRTSRTGRNLQLAQLRLGFRLQSSPTATIQHFLWCSWQPLLQAVPLDTLEARVQIHAIGQVDPPLAQINPNSPMPQNVTLTKPHNKQKSLKIYLETQCSDQWRKHLEIALSNPPGRVRAYVHWHLHQKHQRSMYKPAPNLTHQSSPYQLKLLRIHTQHTSATLYLPISISHSGTHKLITNIVCVHTVFPQVPGSSLMSFT